MTGESPPTGNATQEGGAPGNNQRDDPSRLYELPDDQKIFVGNLAPDLEDATFRGWMEKADSTGWYPHLFQKLVSWIFASSAEWEGFLYTRVKLMVDTVYSYAAEWSP